MKVTGVGFGVDVFVVEPGDKSYKARRLDDAEVAEHDEFMRAAEEAMRGVRKALTEQPETAAPVETPPTLPSEGSAQTETREWRC
jgi:hypothetical protein